MMRYLQKQKQSVISNTGFKRRCYLLAAILLLLSVTLPLAVVGDMPAAHDIRVQIDTQQSTDTPIQTLSKPSMHSNELQYAVRENDVLRGAQMLQWRTSFRYRNLQQVRLFVWYIMVGLLFLPVLLFACFGDGKRRQQELIPRSLKIVLYRNRSDGKKEGIAFSIK